jgi:hypothetical protein
MREKVGRWNYCTIGGIRAERKKKGEKSSHAFLICCLIYFKKKNKQLNPLQLNHLSSVLERQKSQIDQFMTE